MNWGIILDLFWRTLFFWGGSEIRRLQSTSLDCSKSSYTGWCNILKR